MFDSLAAIFQIDWRIFMAATRAWLEGRNPYGALSAEFSAGAFAYPPTALPWLVLFLALGPLGYYVWTALQLLGWWLLARHERPGHMLLLVWSPIILHVVEGQSTLPAILTLWAASRARQRGWLWGLAVAWALTKPQAAIIPALWLLWHDRAAPSRWRFIGGITLGTALLALPITLRDPSIWLAWLEGLAAYRERILQMAPWQGPSVALLALAAYLWHRSGRGGWQWWLPAGLLPHTSFYDTVTLLPALDPRPNGWALAGLALAGVLQGPVTSLTLPWILAGQLLAAWMIAGGPRPRPAEGPARRTAAPPHGDAAY